MVRRLTIFLVAAGLAGCNALDPAVLYRCEATGSSDSVDDFPSPLLSPSLLSPGKDDTA